MCAFTAIACVTFFISLINLFGHPLFWGILLEAFISFPYMSIWYLFRRYKMAGWKKSVPEKNEQYITTETRPDTNKLFFIFLCICYKYNHWVFVSAIANSYRFEFDHTPFSLLIVPGCTTGDAYCIFIFFSGALIFWPAVIYRLYNPLYFPFPLPFWILVSQIFLLWNNLHHSFLSHF